MAVLQHHREAFASNDYISISRIPLPLFKALLTLTPSIPIRGEDDALCFVRFIWPSHSLYDSQVLRWLRLNQEPAGARFCLLKAVRMPRLSRSFLYDLIPYLIREKKGDLAILTGTSPVSRPILSTQSHSS